MTFVFGVLETMLLFGLPHTVTFLRLKRSRNLSNRARLYGTMPCRHFEAQISFLFNYSIAYVNTSFLLN